MCSLDKNISVLENLKNSHVGLITNLKSFDLEAYASLSVWYFLNKYWCIPLFGLNWLFISTILSFWLIVKIRARFIMYQPTWNNWKNTTRIQDGKSWSISVPFRSQWPSGHVYGLFNGKHLWFDLYLKKIWVVSSRLNTMSRSAQLNQPSWYVFKPLAEGLTFFKCHTQFQLIWYSTCGLDDVFPPGDLGSSLYLLSYTYHVL